MFKKIVTISLISLSLAGCESFGHLMPNSKTVYLDSYFEVTPEQQKASAMWTFNDGGYNCHLFTEGSIEKSGLIEFTVMSISCTSKEGDVVSGKITGTIKDPHNQDKWLLPSEKHVNYVTSNKREFLVYKMPEGTQGTAVLVRNK